MRNRPPIPASIAGRLVSLSLVALVIAGIALFAADTTQSTASRNEEIAMTVGKSVILDHPDEIARISISNPDIADAVAVSTKEVLLNAKAPGITTLVIWSKNGERNFFTLNVSANLQQIQQQIQNTFPGEDIRVLVSANAVSLVGRVSTPAVAEKAAAMVTTLGRTVVNNLSVAPAPSEKQIILKVRFAEIQRSAQQQLGANLLSTGALNTPGGISTQQFGPARVDTLAGTIGGAVTGTATTFTLNDVLNIFAFRPDLNLGVLIKALEANNLIQTLAEPNLVATSGKEATFLAGGEFPFPVIQGGANAGAVTIQFREFGIKLMFLPVVTATNSIRMHVRPEVSALDFANALTISGFTIPALSTRRVETDVELQPGQSFVIAGLLDRSVTENLSRIPGLASIPLLGNIFKSRNVLKNNSELLVLVTPEFPEAIEAGAPKPALRYPKDFMPSPPMPGYNTEQVGHEHDQQEQQQKKMK
jgi:pilus assembly protein CpaC